MDVCRTRMLDLFTCYAASLGGKKTECEEWTDCQEILVPSASPTAVPSLAPTGAPHDLPSARPSATPTVSPSPTIAPSASPTIKLPPCSTEDGVLSCEYRSSYTSSKGSTTRVDAVVQCLVETDDKGLEVPQSDCHCEATLTSDSGPDKICRCSVCDLMSDQPVSVDCRNNREDPFIAESCTALSCNAECSDSGSFKVQMLADRQTLTSLNRTDVSTGFYPKNFVPALGKVFFHASSKDTGYEVWVTDGTLRGTRVVKDINPGKGKSVNQNGRDFELQTEELHGKLLFFANDGVHGKELWSTSGTEKGTKMVKDIVEDGNGALRGSFSKYGDKLYFTMMQEDQPDQLWMTNGTSEGTAPVGDYFIFPPDTHIMSLIENTTFDGKSYFIIKPTNGSDVFLYTSDGTKEGTESISKIRTTGNSQQLVEFKDKLYIKARTLWMTDGTEEGTLEVRGPSGSPFSVPQSMVVANGLLFFFSDCDLFRTDGTSEGFVKLLEQPGSSTCSNELVKLGNKVLLRSGGQPYVSDGTAAGTFRVVDANLTSSTLYAVHNDQVAFFAATSKSNTYGHGHDLWVTDGTPENTIGIPGIGVNKQGLFPHFDNLFVAQNSVYMTVWYLFAPGDELWKVDIPEDIEGLFESLSWDSGLELTAAPSDAASEVAALLEVNDTELTSAPSDVESEVSAVLVVNETTSAPTDVASEVTALLGVASNETNLDNNDTWTVPTITSILRKYQQT